LPFAQSIASFFSASQGVTLAHFLHIPIDECVISLYDGNVQFPELQSGMSVYRAVLELIKPSRIVTLVSMSRPGKPLRCVRLVSCMYRAILINAPADIEGWSQGTNLTACWLSGPIPTERTRTMHSISAGSLFKISAS
jgi:hypothetical protein